MEAPRVRKAPVGRRRFCQPVGLAATSERGAKAAGLPRHRHAPADPGSASPLLSGEQASCVVWLWGVPGPAGLFRPPSSSSSYPPRTLLPVLPLRSAPGPHDPSWDLTVTGPAGGPSGRVHKRGHWLSPSPAEPAACTFRLFGAGLRPRGLAPTCELAWAGRD